MTANDQLSRAAGVRTEECISSNLSLFEPISSEDFVEKYYYTEVFPAMALSESSNSIYFAVQPSPDLTDMNQSYFRLRQRITKNNGDAIDGFHAAAAAAGGNPALTNNSVGYANCAANVVWSSVNFRLNDENLSDNYNNHVYKIYIFNLLNYGKEARQTVLSLTGFYEDSNPNNNTAHTGGSGGFYDLAQRTKLSHEVTFLSPLYDPLSCQSRYLTSMTPFSMEFVKASPNFALKTNATSGDWKNDIKAMSLMIKRVKVRDSYKVELENELKKQAAQYPITHTWVRPFFIDANTHSFSVEDAFQSRALPTQVYIMLTTQAAYRGSQTTSPFFFRTYSLTCIKFTIDSDVYELKCDFGSATAKDWSAAYLALFKNNIKYNHQMKITYEDFAERGFMITWA